MTGHFDINQQTYDWCARAFEQVRKLLSLRIKMHHQRHQIDGGEIFLFNHFARMETFIPQYLIYQETGHLCRSIASAEFFARDDRFARMLRDLGVVPNDHPELMPLLARDILRGRKVVVFPEGGMVKDRQVVDERGRYSVYSRHAQTRRKHHTGAARLATGLQVFRYAVQYRAARGDSAMLDAWRRELGMATVDEMLAAARRPVTLVPANITFYPLRVSDNILRRAAEFMGKNLSKRAIEELVVEGNLLLKETDMDIHLGEDLAVHEDLTWYQRPALRHLARGLPSLSAAFDIEYLESHWTRRLATRGAQQVIDGLRDRYMRAIYQSAAVNLSHLASSLILAYVERGVTRVGAAEFRTALYLAIKHVQGHRNIKLHRGLCDPARYQAVLDNGPSALHEFFDSAESAALIERSDDALLFKDKLVQEHGFDEIRLENPVEVYANEVAPLAPVGAAVAQALARSTTLGAEALALERFDDEIKALAWDRARYSQSEHHDINQRETATADPSPFLFRDGGARPLGVVLVHGFLASPAEVREFGEKLHAAGYPVLGVRLKGHGTSPWDLRARSWQDWLASVTRAIDIMSALTPRVALVGFSTGGSLSLIAASTGAPSIVGVAAVCAPLKFRNRNLRFVPLMHGANRIVNWLSSYEGMMPFRPNESEHPHINYRNIPLRGLYELTRVANHLGTVLDDVHCAVTLIQADADQVVDPDSARIAHRKLASLDKQLHWVASRRHGILNEDVGATHTLILDFLAHCAQRDESHAPRETR